MAPTEEESNKDKNRRDSSLTKLPEEGDEVEELDADCEEFDGIGGVAQAGSYEPSQEGMSPLRLGNGVWVLLVFGLIRALKGGICRKKSASSLCVSSCLPWRLGEQRRRWKLWHSQLQHGAWLLFAGRAN